MKILKQFMILLFIILAFYECKKDNLTSPLTNNLTGFTYLCDTSGIREANNSGIVVSIEGTSISTTTGMDKKNATYRSTLR